jgi:hypothetical protein
MNGWGARENTVIHQPTMDTMKLTSQPGREPVIGISNTAGKLACIKLAVDVRVST